MAIEVMKIPNIKVELIKKETYRSIGIIGMGKIGEALITQLVNLHEDLKLNDIFIYSRPKETERVQGVITQVSTLDSTFYENIHRVEDLRELGKDSGVIVISIGRKEGGNKTREDLTGQYFHDIKNIMEGIGDSKSTIFMATNPVTPNCLVADIYSQQQTPNVIGFTRMDYKRATHIVTKWLRGEEGIRNISDWHIDVDVFGPHGIGLLISNIRIGKDIKRIKPIFTNEDLKLFFDDPNKTIERLSKETADFGENLYRATSPEGTPSSFAYEITESLERILNSEKERTDTAAIDINLGEICRSGLSLPRGPVYASVPVVYYRGYPKINPNFDINNIPEGYRRNLLRTLIEEETRIINYLNNHKNGFSKLREHFGLQ